MHRICAFYLLVFAVSGCVVVPLSSKQVTGAPFSREALAFLDQPGTTRIDVLSSLGKPLFEMSEPGALIYVSERISRTYVIPYQVYGIPLSQESGVVDGPSTTKALFIAYDKMGNVTAHEVRVVEPTALESECLKWRLGLTKPQDTQSYN